MSLFKGLLCLTFIFFLVRAQDDFLINNYNLSLIKDVPNHNLLCFTKLYGVSAYSDESKKRKYKGLQLVSNTQPLPVIVDKADPTPIDPIVNSKYFVLPDGVIFNNTMDYCKELEEFTVSMESKSNNVRNLLSRNLNGRFLFKKLTQET